MYYFSIFVTDYLCVKIISPLIHCRLLPFKIRDKNDEIHKAIFMHKNRGIILYCLLQSTLCAKSTNKCRSSC